MNIYLNGSSVGIYFSSLISLFFPNFVSGGYFGAIDIVAISKPTGILAVTGRALTFVTPAGLFSSENVALV